MDSVKATAADFAAAKPLPDPDAWAWDWLLGGTGGDPRKEFDEIAETWLYRLLGVVREAMDAMSQIRLDWPDAADLQQADPSAGQQAAGVAARPTLTGALPRPAGRASTNPRSRHHLPGSCRRGARGRDGADTAGHGTDLPCGRSVGVAPTGFEPALPP